MVLKEVTLLGEDECTKYKSLIPVIDDWWWLKTPYCNSKYNCVRAVDDCGSLNFCDCNYNYGGVRPFCIFELESVDPIFWHKPGRLVGSKIKCGKYNWTVLDVTNGELYVLCDNIIDYRRFDPATNDWETSELKQWLETEGLKLITT